jgi:hypothetical protein
MTSEGERLCRMAKMPGGYTVTFSCRLDQKYRVRARDWRICNARLACREGDAAGDGRTISAPNRCFCAP